MDAVTVMSISSSINTNSKTMPTPAKSAQVVGLRYVTDERPGIRRERCGRGFRYRSAEGRVIRNRHTLKRIESLVIPPAWEEVWICPLDHGHLQATGRDERERKQHLYHPRWREIRNQTKYDRLMDFARALPVIRRQLKRDLAREGLCREKVLATVVRLLEVRLVRVCQDLPGQELFQYVDDAGQKHDVGSGDVNDYLREITGQDFTAKDFRTWAGTVSAASELQQLGPAELETEARKNVVAAVKATAQSLGNTPAVCRKSYIHPAIIAAYLDGSLIPGLNEWKGKTSSNSSCRLRPKEAAVLRFLKRASSGRKKCAHSTN